MRSPWGFFRFQVLIGFLMKLNQLTAKFWINYNGSYKPVLKTILKPRYTRGSGRKPKSRRGGFKAVAGIKLPWKVVGRLTGALRTIPGLPGNYYSARAIVEEMIEEYGE